jgi:DNA helicase HerA-like ATPase
LLWLLSELFEELPEVGDPEKPRLVFFFDEAHLLFHDAPQALIDRIEQVVRLIRSKGVGVYFVTHAPRDVPDRVLGQLGNRVQHALRAFTPRDQKAVRAAAETFRANPSIDVAREITELGIGEALVSFLGGDGAPSVVERVKVRPPASRLGPVSAAERTETLSRSPVGPTYDRAIDRESAHEMLAARAEAATRSSRATDEDAVDTDAGSTGRSRPSRSSRTRESAGEALMKSAARSLGTQIGRQIIRSILGSIRRG